jgi:hypothetical protein
MARSIPCALGACFLVCVVATTASAQPAAPANLHWSIDGNTVTFTWTPVAAAGGYRLDAGSGPGATDIATLAIGATSRYSVPDVPPGTYYVRLRAIDGSGISSPSNEVLVTVGGGETTCSEPPKTPSALRAVVDGTQVNVSWTPSGCAATSYVLRAGSSDGAADLAQISVAGPAFSTGAPDGIYFVSVVAVNFYGASAPTGSVIVLVAAPRTGGRVGFNTATPAIVADGRGYAVVVGEVVNRSVAAAVFIQVVAQLRDSQGGILGSASTFLRGQPRRLQATGIIDDSGLAPGQVGCFYIQTSIPMSGVHNASLQLAHDSFASTPPRSQVDAVDVSRLPDPRFAKLAVTAVNRGPDVAHFNVANMYLKRSDGRAVGCDLAFADDSLAPGQTTTISASTHAPSNVSSLIAWMHWQEAADPLAGLAAQTYRAMRDLINAGQKHEAIAAWELLQSQRRAAAAQAGQ